MLFENKIIVYCEINYEATMYLYMKLRYILITKMIKCLYFNSKFYDLFINISSFTT